MNDTETFQHYQVLKHEDGSLWELGRGAMGVTYKAFDVNLRCHVALKVVNNQFLDSEMARARFLREARAAAGLRHRNVASVYHLGNDEDSFFYSMEFIDGLTVESLVANQGPLPATQALQIALQVARALGAAAKQGVVHRDIKPANLMVVHEDDGEEQGFVVKVIDFGLARSAMAGGEHSGHITMGGFVGTPQYASPEQIEEKDLDVRSDIYSLGITLWYMLAGQPPFTGTVFRISSQHLTKEPPWADIEASTSPAVRALLSRMLQKDPADRPQTPALLRAEIDECLRGLPADSTPGLAMAPSALNTDTRFPEEEETASVTVVQGPAPTVGRIFAGRYQLAELAGEGSSGQTFRCYDGRLDGKLVALKVLHPGLNLSPQAFYHLQGDLGRLRDAPHPQLIETNSLERVHGYKFSVMEWVNGYPLATISRPGGAWLLRDALRLLGLMADAAAHCSAHRLHRLELSAHKILLHFPELGEDDPPPDAASLTERPLGKWPRFCLKVDALAPAREAGRTSSRDSGVGGTPRLPARDTLSSIRGLVEGSYFYALGALLHELLGAPPPTPAQTEALPPLAELSAESNAVLKRAFSTNPGFATENEFFQALLQSCGWQREDVGLGRPQADDPTPSSMRTTVRAAGTDVPTRVPPAPRPVSGPSPVENRARPAAPASTPPARVPAPPSPPPAEERTLTRDKAETFVRPERPAPAPPAPLTLETRPKPVTPKPAKDAIIPILRKSEVPVATPPTPPVVPGPVVPPVEEIPLPLPVATVPTPPLIEPAAATFTPSAIATLDPPLPEAVTVAPVASQNLPPETVPATKPETRRDHRKKFPLVPALAIAAVVLGGLVAVVTLFRPQPAPTKPEKTRTDSRAAHTPAASVPPVPTPVQTALSIASPATDNVPLAVNRPSTAETPAVVVPTPALVVEDTPVAMEVVADPLSAAATPAPTAVVPLVTSAVSPAAGSPHTVPSPPPRRDSKVPLTTSTPRVVHPPSTPPKGNTAGQIGGNKPKPTPPKPLKTTPPPRNDDAPDFMR